MYERVLVSYLYIHVVTTAIVILIGILYSIHYAVCTM